MRTVLLLATASAVVAVAVGQDEGAQPRPPAATPPPASAPPASPPPGGAAEPGPQDSSGASDEEFIPTEELSADAQVTFPVDI
jgi:hypothetical protein